jgi:hypothetical protein
MGTCETCQHWVARPDHLTPEYRQCRKVGLDTAGHVTCDYDLDVDIHPNCDSIRKQHRDRIAFRQANPAAVLADFGNFAPFYTRKEFGCSLHTPVQTPPKSE